MQQRSSPSSPWQPLAFFSRKLEPAQIRYSTFDQELFACFAGIRHFRYMLEGWPFTIYMDHKPFYMPWVWWLMAGWRYSAGNCPTWQSLQQIFAMCLVWDNVVDDTLSRPPSHTARPDSCFHTAGPENCSHSARDVSAVSPSAELLDCAGIAKNQVTYPLNKKAASSSSSLY